MAEGSFCLELFAEWQCEWQAGGQDFRVWPGARGSRQEETVEMHMNVGKQGQRQEVSNQVGTDRGMMRREKQTEGRGQEGIMTIRNL